MQLWAISLPGAGEGSQGGTLGQGSVDLRQLLLAALLVLGQLLQLLLELGGGQVGLLAGLAGLGQFLLQAGEGVLLGESLAQARGVFALAGLGLAQRLTG
ncbi:hypothetical protein D3C80_1530270 [compost metagenome]